MIIPQGAGDPLERVHFFQPGQDGWSAGTKPSLPHDECENECEKQFVYVFVPRQCDEELLKDRGRVLLKLKSEAQSLRLKLLKCISCEDHKDARDFSRLEDQLCITDQSCDDDADVVSLSTEPESQESQEENTNSDGKSGDNGQGDNGHRDICGAWKDHST